MNDLGTMQGWRISVLAIGVASIVVGFIVPAPDSFNVLTPHPAPSDRLLSKILKDFSEPARRTSQGGCFDEGATARSPSHRHGARCTGWT